MMMPGYGLYNHKNAQTQIQSHNTQIHKYKHTNTQVQTYKYKYQIYIHKNMNNEHTVPDAENATLLTSLLTIKKSE